MHKYTLKNNLPTKVKYHLEEEVEDWYWNEDNSPEAIELMDNLKPEQELNFD